MKKKEPGPTWKDARAALTNLADLLKIKPPKTKKETMACITALATPERSKKKITERVVQIMKNPEAAKRFAKALDTSMTPFAHPESPFLSKPEIERTYYECQIPDPIPDHANKACRVRPDLTELEAQALGAIVKRGDTLRNVWRKSYREFDLFIEGFSGGSNRTLQQKSLFEAWLPLYAIRELLLWSHPLIADMTGDPEATRAGKWEGVYRTPEFKQWEIFQKYGKAAILGRFGSLLAIETRKSGSNPS